MSRLQIGNNDPQTTFTANVANNRSLVWSILVPPKVVYSIFDNALLVLKAKKGDGTEISPDSEITIGAIRPGKKIPTEVDSFSYLPWNNLNFQQQYDDRQNGALRLSIAKGRLDLLEEHRLQILIDSPDVVDNSKSTFELQFQEAPFRDAMLKG